MPRKQYEPCPNCGEKKVAVTTDNKVQIVLHNLHIIHAPYEEHRAWVCHSCGWVAAVRWHGENYAPRVYADVTMALAPKPEPEPEVETFTFEPVEDYSE